MLLYNEYTARPMAISKSHPVHVHWEDQVKKGIDGDVNLGVMEWVPLDAPTTWCS